MNLNESVGGKDNLEQYWVNLSEFQCDGMNLNGTVWNVVNLSDFQWNYMNLRKSVRVCMISEWSWMGLSRSGRGFNLSEIGWIWMRLSKSKWDWMNPSKSEVTGCIWASLGESVSRMQVWVRLNESVCKRRQTQRPASETPPIPPISYPAWAGPVRMEKLKAMIKLRARAARLDHDLKINLHNLRRQRYSPRY